jgi:membrane protease subunit HflC
MRRTPTVLIAGIVIVVLLLYAFAFQVRFTETAVVTRFEKPVDREVAPGLNFRRWPWPIERVHTYDRRLRAYETQFTQLSTQDQKTLTVTAFATWGISRAAQFLKAVGREEAAADKIGDLLKNSVSKVFKRHPLSDLINTDPARIRYREIEEEIRAAVKDDALNSYGIEVADVGIARLGLPEKNTQAVADRMKAERKAVSDRLEAEGDAEAKRITETAQAVVSKILERARSYAKTIEGQGEAQAARYYKVFEENLELATMLKQFETLVRIMNSGESTVVLDAHEITPFNLLPERPAGGEPSSRPPSPRDAEVQRENPAAME